RQQPVFDRCRRPHGPAAARVRPRAGVAGRGTAPEQPGGLRVDRRAVFRRRDRSARAHRCDCTRRGAAAVRRLRARGRGLAGAMEPRLAIEARAGESSGFLSVGGSTMRHRMLRTAGLLLFLLAAPALAAGGMTLEQIAKTRTVTRAEISPDGRQVAHVLSVPREIGVDEDGAAWAELQLVSRVGASRGCVTGEVSGGWPGWSADGGAVASRARGEGDDARTLYRVAVGGGESVAIATLESDGRAFSL